MTFVRLITLPVLVATVLGCFPGAAAPRTTQSAARAIVVQDAAGFQKAVSSLPAGGTIQLAAGSYPLLSVGRKFSQPVTITGAGASTVVAGMTLWGAQNVVVSNLTIAPTSAPVSISVDHASKITIDHVRFAGKDESLGSSLEFQPNATDVVVQGSTFTQCGQSDACVLAKGTGMTVRGNSFDQLIDADGVRGIGSNVLITENTFDHGLQGSGSNHNDFVQVMGGGPWTISRNRFGQRDHGAAQVFISPVSTGTAGPIHDVRVESNIFFGNMYFAIQVGGGNGVVGPPSNLLIANNTILSGTNAAIRINPAVSSLPSDQLPIVANNIEAVQKPQLCDVAQTFSNLVVDGKGCTGDLTGAADLDSTYAPTTRSAHVLGRADPRYAPAVDFFGRAWKGAPDIGAVYLSRAAVLKLLASARLTLRLHTLEARRWHLRVTAAAAGATSIEARLLHGSSTIARRVLRASTAPTADFLLPKKWRKAGVVLRVSWTAHGSTGAVHRTTTIRIVR